MASAMTGRMAESSACALVLMNAPCIADARVESGKCDCSGDHGMTDIAQCAFTQLPCHLSEESDRSSADCKRIHCRTPACHRFARSERKMRTIDGTASRHRQRKKRCQRMHQADEGKTQPMATIEQCHGGSRFHGTHLAWHALQVRTDVETRQAP
jgi:hypothetical protein